MNSLLRRHLISLPLMSLGLLAGCAEPNDAPRGEMPRPGEQVVGVATEAELERVATAVAAALRQSPLVTQSSRPIRVAPPTFENTSNVVVAEPHAVVDALTSRVNERVGGNVQFLPGSSAAPIAGGTSLASADYESRMTLLPDRRGSSRRLRLRTELRRPGGGTVVFSRDEPIEVASAVARNARKRGEALADASKSPGPNREEPLPAKPSQAEPPAAMSSAPRGEEEVIELSDPKKPEAKRASETPPDKGAIAVRFAEEELSRRVRVASPRLRVRSDGRLEVLARLLSRGGRRQQVSVRATFFDGSGREIEVSQAALRSLRPGKPVSIAIKSRQPAARCVLTVDEA